MISKPYLFALLLAVTLTACGTTGTGSDSSAVRDGYGTVDGIQTVDRDNPGVLGMIGGAVVGGLLGNQVGSGTGQTAATIAGAAGGAFVGREAERRVRDTSQIYKIIVRMDDGAYQAIAQETQPALRAGDRVRIQNGVVTPY